MLRVRSKVSGKCSGREWVREGGRDERRLRFTGCVEQAVVRVGGAGCAWGLCNARAAD